MLAGQIAILLLHSLRKIFKALGINYLMDVAPKAFNAGEYADDEAAMKELKELLNLLKSSLLK